MLKRSLPDARAFEAEILRLWTNASNAGAPSVDVTAGELHRSLGGYPANVGGHRMPNCCRVMKGLMQPGDIVLHAPPKGEGASLEIRYKLPRSTTLVSTT
jgi:hypothetical protein